LAAGALLCREQNVVVVVIVLLAALWRRDQRAVASLAAALLVWVGWVAVVWLGYGAKPFLSGSDNFQTPLAGLIHRWRCPCGEEEVIPRIAFAKATAIVHLTLLIGLGSYLVCRPGSRTVRLVLLAGVALALLGGPALYGDMWSFSRVFVWIPLAIWLLAVQTGSRWQLACLLPGGACSLAATLHYV
jgi:hypothetical protein